MNGGIDQLVDTYKGNPQPLAQKVQQAQKHQPPGSIPPDLEEALALQQIAELRNSAQAQQAMQAGGPQPTVVQKLQQMLGAQQAQAQMPQMPQGQPVMAASGGSIAHLVSNLGRHYAGGGIIAFQSAGQVKDPEKESSSQFMQDISALPEKFDELKQRAREEDAIKAEQDRRMAQYKQDKLAAQQKTSLFNYLFGSPEREKAGAAKLAELSNAPSAAGKPTAAPDLGTIRSQLNAADAPRFAEKPAPKPPVAPRPSVVTPVASEKAAAVDPNSLRALADKYIREEMGLNPETESDKAVARARKLMGLDALLKEKEGRASDKEKYIDEMKAKRAPLWIDALMSAGKPTRGGIAGVLQNMAVGASAARQNYEAEDLKYIDELNRLRDIITDAKITGNKELAKEALAAFKETDARRKAALTSATSLLNTDEMTATRKQIAKDAAAGRAIQTADAASQRKMANAINAVKSDEVINRLQKRAEELGKMSTPANKLAAEDIMRQIDARQNAIYKQFGVLEGLSTIAAAPSAASPSGTSLKYNPKTGKIE